MDTGSVELLGYAAAGLVLATFSVRSITTLRSIAIASNVLFIAYAAAAGLLPVLVLHALLLPLNLLRLREALAAPLPAVRSSGRRRGTLTPAGRQVAAPHAPRHHPARRRPWCDCRHRTERHPSWLPTRRPVRLPAPVWPARSSGACATAAGSDRRASTAARRAPAPPW